MRKAFKTIVPVLDELSKMSSKTLIIDADQIITSKLLPVKSAIPKPKKLVDEQFSALEDFLLKILRVNNGQLSMQCSMRIAECLLALYADHRANQIWNLATAFKKSPQQANTYALGYVLSKIGHHCKSMINGLAGSIISLSDKLLIPQLFALCACVKSSSKDVEQLSDKMFSIAKKHIMVPNEPVQLLCLKLLRRLVKAKLVNVEKVVPLIHQLLENQVMPYIIDQSSLVVATMAVACIKSPIVQSKDVSDVEFAKASFEKERKAINDDVKKSLNILCQFKGHIVESFTKYLSLLSPAFINFIRKDLFSFVRKSAPRAIPQLISLLGVDVRKEIFTEVAKEPASSEQLSLLCVLSFDMSTLTEAAGLAMQLAQKKVSKTRSEGSQFYNILVERDPELAMSFLKTSALYLATPPEDSPTINEELRGMALICASILTAVPNKKQMIALVESDLVKFLKNAWKCECVLDKFYQPAFILMSALPRKYVRKEEIDRLMSLYLQYILMNEVKTEEQINMASMIGEAVALFISVHPDFESTIPVIGCIFEQSYLLTNVVQTCIFRAYSSLKADSAEMINFANKLRAVVLKGSPDPEYGSLRVAHPLITRTSLLRITEYTSPVLYDVFVYASNTDVAYRVLKVFPDFVTAIPESERGNWIKALIVSSEKPMMQMNLILSLAQDERTRKFLPLNFHDLMLAKLETITRMDLMQLATESIAIWLSSFTKHIDDVFKSVMERKDKAKCMLYSSICAHNQLPDDKIVTILIDLNEMAKVDQLTPYALFALSSVFLSYPTQLAALPFIEGQATFILSVICSNRSLDPFVLFHCGNCLKALLPIISPNMEKKRPLLVPVVKQIIQMIALTVIPYSKQTLSYVMHAVFTHSKDLGNCIQLEFPKSDGGSLSYQVEACRAFADMLVITATQDDYFSLIPRLLLLIQRTQSQNPTQLVLAIAENFAANAKDVIREQSIRERILEWTKLMKLCLSAGNLPETGSAKIGATLAVKLCLLMVAKELLPLVAASEPLITESLDDIMTCLTRAIDSRNPKMQGVAFPLLVQVIDCFKDRKNDTENSSVLELYDIQFSTAVKFGFSCLDVSSDMVIKYLEFHLKNLETRVESFMTVVGVFVNGLANCENKNHAYYNVAARLCLAASKHSEIYEKIQQYLPRFVQEFADVIFGAVKLWNSDDEVGIAEFRTGFSSFFGDLLTAFIWAQALLKEDIIKPTNFVDFLIGEVTDKRNEDWRVSASFESMTALIHFYPSPKKLTHRMVSKMVNAVSESYKRRSKLLRPTITRFMLESSERIKPKDEEAWNELISLLVDDNFHPTVLCYLMRNGNQETVACYACQFNQVIYDNFLAGKCSQELANALFTMLFYIAADQIPKLLAWVLDIKDRHKENIIKFKFIFLDKLLRFVPASKESHYAKKFSKGLARLIWSNFDNGGLDLAVHIITCFPLLGKNLIGSDLVTEYTNDCFDRLDSVNRFFQFIHFTVSKYDPADDMDTFIMLSIRFIFRCIIQWGDDRANAKAVVTSGAQLLNFLRESSEPLIRVAFKAMGEEFQETATEYVEKYTKRTKTRKNGVNLVFGGGGAKRRKRTMGGDSDDEQWETL